MGSLTTGVNLPLILGIIGILLTVRRLDTEKQLARGFYIIAVTVLGFISGFMVTAYEPPVVTWLQEVLVASFIHAGAASILYQHGKLALPSEDQFRFKTPPEEMDGTDRTDT